MESRGGQDPDLLSRGHRHAQSDGGVVGVRGGGRGQALRRSQRGQALRRLREEAQHVDGHAAGRRCRSRRSGCSPRRSRSALLAATAPAAELRHCQQRRQEVDRLQKESLCPLFPSLFFAM